MPRVRAAHHRPLHQCHGPQVPSRALRLRFLPDTVVKGHLQGAGWQDLLSTLLRETLPAVISAEPTVSADALQNFNQEGKEYFVVTALQLSGRIEKVKVMNS